MRSPLLDLPGAVAASGVDADVAAHYGSFNNEQRALAAGEGFVDLSHRDVIALHGPDRLTWLHALTTQAFEGLAPGVWTDALVLSPQGHLEHGFTGVDDGETFTAHLEPGAAAPLLEWLSRMRFMNRVELAEITAEKAVAWRPQPDGGPIADQVHGRFDLVDREKLTEYAAAVGPAAGLWAYDALRIARGEPRLGVDTDHRTIPNEIGLIPSAVHLDKGCYRGQETVARVHTLGRPPRRLVRLLLDGSENRLPAVGSPVLWEGREIGVVGSSARHYELGPVALALVKRAVSTTDELLVDGVVAAQEVVVDPEVGLHVRPRLG